MLVWRLHAPLGPPHLAASGLASCCQVEEAPHQVPAAAVHLHVVTSRLAAPLGVQNVPEAGDGHVPRLHRLPLRPLHAFLHQELSRRQQEAQEGLTSFLAWYLSLLPFWQKRVWMLVAQLSG